jgi:hypothetical protein
VRIEDGYILSISDNNLYLFLGDLFNKIKNTILYSCPEINCEIRDAVIRWPYAYIGVDTINNYKPEINLIRIMDMRTSSIVNTISLDTSNWPNYIEGHRLLVLYENYLLISNIGKGVEVYDISKSPPQFVYLSPADPHNYNINYSISLSGRYLYAIWRDSYMELVKKFEIRRGILSLVSSVDIHSRCNKVLNFGGYVMCGTNDGNVMIVDDNDISNKMKLYSTYTLNGYESNVAVFGNMLFSINFGRNTYFIKLE